MLAVGAISPRKGYGVLIEALAGLQAQEWHLTIVGAQDRAPEEAGRLHSAVLSAGLEPRIRFAGSLGEDALHTAFDSADIFVMPSLFEGFGMVLCEAMARGLPIVCTTGGAAAHTVPDAAAVKVPPGDSLALRDAIADVLADRALRERLADASWAAGQRLARWPETAQRIASVLNTVMHEVRP
jgi:glycosyltransferase involved in cell wall biosynthesis